MRESPVVFFSHPKTNDEAFARLAAALKSHGYTSNAVADTSLGEPIEQSVRQMIEKSDFVIADLTGNNPNVMFEVGFAEGIGKSILPIVQDTERQVSPHIAGMLYVPYNPQQPDNMIKYVLSWLKRNQPESQRIAI